MIGQIYGKLIVKTDQSVVVDTGGMCYEVFLPQNVMKKIEEQSTGEDESIRLITYHYYRVNQSSSIPVLIGFSNQIERDFFEQFISVSGIGPMAAVKALHKPISEIARAIDDADVNYLCSLPGVGTKKSKLLIASLQGKVGKFALMKDRARQISVSSGKISEEIKKEALEILKQLQYKKKEAENMINEALREQPDINTVEELLNYVYRKNKPRAGQDRSAD